MPPRSTTPCGTTHATRKKPTVAKSKPSSFTPALHSKFRTAVRRIRTQRSPRFVKSRRAYVLRGKSLKGVHGVVQSAFGSLGKLIYAAGGCEHNQSTRSATATSRGTRIGRELVRMASKPTSTLTKKSKPSAWSTAVSTALRLWGLYLVDGEVPVSRGYMATGVDLLAVERDPADPTKWRFRCIELKTGYKGPVWRAQCSGKTSAGVPKSVLNYALTQAMLTHHCARSTFKEYDFGEPLVVLVNDDGVQKFSPCEAVRQQAVKLLSV